MKLRHLFVSILAAAGLLMTSCQEKEKDLGLPEIKITQNELALDQNVNSVNLNVYATRNWTVSTAADWISVNPSKGSAYQETAVTVTVLENAGYNRVGTVKFDIGYDSKTLTINQTGAQGEKSEGSGTMTDPYTVAGVLAFIQTLGTETSENAVYIKGKIAAITLTYEASGTYGNARFTMVDEGSTEAFTAYNVLYLGNKKWSTGKTDIKEGDEVIVCSKVFNYGGKTPETATGGYLYSLNGETAGGGGSGDEAKGTGTLDDPYNPAGAAAAVASLTWTSTTDYQTTDPVYVKGKISKIADKGTYTDGGTYGNATFYITETGESTGTEFYVYRILYLGNKKYESGKTDIKVGDEVIIYGKLMNYGGKTPETASGGYLYSLNGETGTSASDQPKGEGTLDNPYNPAAAVAAVANLTWTSTTEYQTTDPVYVKGKISKIANNGTYTQGGTYGNASFYMTETGEEGTEFYAFHVLYLENKKFVTGQTDIKVGDEVIIYGKLMNYCGNTPETASGCYLYSLNGDTGTGGGGGGSDEAKGTGTLADPFNPAGAVNAVKDLTWTSTTEYQTTDEVYVKGKISKIANKGTFTEGGTYGNASFYITETGETGGTEFYAFRILYLKNQKFAAGQTDIKVGDEVIIHGKLMNYYGDTPETVSGAAYLYSLNGSTEPGSGGGQGGGGGEGNKIKFKKVTTVTSGKTYIIVASGTKMAKPIASDKTYGYLNVADVTDNNGVIELDNTDNTFVFTNSDDGWTIKQKDGRFLYQSGTFNSFNVNAAPTEGQYWTVEAQAADGTFKITNKSVNKYIQFDSAYSSYGSYDSAKGALPALYEMDGEDGGSGGGQGGGGETGNGITLTFPDENKANNEVSGYTTSWTAKIGSNSWTIANFNNNKWGNNWNYIRGGRKEVASVAEIVTDQAFSKSIAKVVVTYSKVNAADKINSTKLIVATDASFTQGVQEIPMTVTAAGDVTYTVTTPAANCYYKLVFDFAGHTANGIIEITKVVYAE